MSCVLVGDCLEVMPTLEAASFDSIVTDPPYHLTQNSRGGHARTNNPETPHGRTRIGDKGFMGKNWDGGDIAFQVDTWCKALRVAKPGAHLLAFGGTRTFHRMMVAIEDAGWELRDTIMWVYGSGFPKSHNLEGEWEGWGTALKPAWEPIIVARKPLAGTVAENMGKHRTGALNIDGSRIDGEPWHRNNTGGLAEMCEGWRMRPNIKQNSSGGRWPANLIHDGSDEVIALFPAEAGAFAAVLGTEPSSKTDGIFGKFDARTASEFRGDAGSAARFFYCAKADRQDRDEGLEGRDKKPLLWSAGTQNPGSFQSDNTDRSARNFHPTVKPTALMRYLCRLVTPPGGAILDLFGGSGSTGKAGALEGFDVTLIEREAEYVDIARGRIDYVDPEKLFA